MDMVMVMVWCIVVGVGLLPPTHAVDYKLEYACDPDGPRELLFPFCNASLSDEDRVTDLIARLTVPEKIEQLVNTAASVPRLGIPAYQWWGEGLHGVANSPSVHFGGSTPTATSFPLPILTAASFNRHLWNKIAQVWHHFLTWRYLCPKATCGYCGCTSTRSCTFFNVF